MIKQAFLVAVFVSLITIRVSPGFYNYLLSYRDAKPANVESRFYWDNVKFGLKPTLRIVQVLTLHGTTPQEPAYAIAEKQLYSSHYFQTALDLSVSVLVDLNVFVWVSKQKVFGANYALVAGLPITNSARSTRSRQQSKDIPCRLRARSRSERRSGMMESRIRAAATT